MDFGQSHNEIEVAADTPGQISTFVNVVEQWTGPRKSFLSEHSGRKRKGVPNIISSLPSAQASLFQFANKN